MTTLDPRAQAIWDAVEARIDASPIDGMSAEGEYSETIFNGQRLYVDGLRGGRLAAINALSSIPEQGVGVKPEWRCFHCDEVFTDEHAARLHFGNDEGRIPACQIKGSEGGLVEALRRAENDAANAWFAIHNESTDAAKAYFAQNARHQEQLRAVEQIGYDRGIADAKAYPETLGLASSHPAAVTVTDEMVERAWAEVTAFDFDRARMRRAIEAALVDRDR